MQQPPPPAPAAAPFSSAPAPQSLVSRARTAIHSAAARVLTDIKADLRGAPASPGVVLGFAGPNLMSSRRGSVVLGCRCGRIRRAKQGAVAEDFAGSGA